MWGPRTLNADDDDDDVLHCIITIEDVFMMCNRFEANINFHTCSIKNLEVTK